MFIGNWAQSNPKGFVKCYCEGSEIDVNFSIIPPPLWDDQCIQNLNLSFNLSTKGYIEKKKTEDEPEIFRVVEVMAEFPCVKFKNIVDKDGIITNVTLVRGVDRNFDAEGAKEYCGELGFLKYIWNNVKYPAYAKEYNITGKVYVSYIVEKDGSVTNVKVVRGVDKNLDAEAVRVIKSLPKYKPGTQRGKPIRVMFTVPINFTLN